MWSTPARSPSCICVRPACSRARRRAAPIRSRRGSVQSGGWSVDMHQRCVDLDRMSLPGQVNSAIMGGRPVCASPLGSATWRQASVKTPRPAPDWGRGGLPCAAEDPHRHNRWGSSSLWAWPPRRDTTDSGRRVSGARGESRLPLPWAALYVLRAPIPSPRKSDRKGHSAWGCGPYVAPIMETAPRSR